MPVSERRQIHVAGRIPDSEDVRLMKGGREDFRVLEIIPFPLPLFLSNMY